MSVSLTVGSETFQYPEPGTKAGWGEEATCWAVAVTNKLATLSGPNDINCTCVAILNNKSTATNVGSGATALSFPIAAVRSFVVDYNVIRTTSYSAVCVAAACVNACCNTFTKANHGYYTGDTVGQFTTSACDLPCGVSLATNYYIIKVDACSFKIATSYNNALAGTAVCIGDAGTGTHIFTPIAYSNVEVGNMYGIYNGSTWTFNHDHAGCAGMDFSITPAGQIQYYSDASKGAGTITFRARTIDQ